MNKWVKTSIIVLTIFPWSLLIIFLISFKDLVFNSRDNKDISTIEVTDTLINNQPEFLNKTPQEGLIEALNYYDVSHKDIVYAQAVLETGNFTSDVCLKYNNLFGLYDSKAKDYNKFNHWSESVAAYKNWVQYKYQAPKDYYKFLEEIKYAGDKNYTKKLKELVE